MFQLTAARRRLDFTYGFASNFLLFQLTAARRRLEWFLRKSSETRRFNSQPREGGWFRPPAMRSTGKTFQLTAARRRLAGALRKMLEETLFQLTAARRRLGGRHGGRLIQNRFNSQPREGGWFVSTFLLSTLFVVSTHSRAKAAGVKFGMVELHRIRFNSQPREGGWPHSDRFLSVCNQFQLTAARRRLVCNLQNFWHTCKFQLTAARRRLAMY